MDQLQRVHDICLPGTILNTILASAVISWMIVVDSSMEESLIDVIAIGGYDYR